MPVFQFYLGFLPHGLAINDNIPVVCFLYVSNHCTFYIAFSLLKWTCRTSVLSQCFNGQPELFPVCVMLFSCVFVVSGRLRWMSYGILSQPSESYEVNPFSLSLQSSRLTQANQLGFAGAWSYEQAGSGTKLRVLCLHSFRTSGAIFQRQIKMSGFGTAFEDILVLFAYL